MICTYIFDVDGTLVDSYSVYYNSLLRTLSEHGRQLPADFDLNVFRSLTAVESLLRLGITDYRHILDTWVQRYNELDTKTQFFDGVLATLQTLHDSGKKIAIVTARGKETFVPLLKRSMENIVDIYVTAEDTQNHKPDPDPLILAIDKLQENPENCIYIGDTNDDYMAAVGANVRFVAAGWNKNADNLPGMRVTHPAQLPELS